MKILLSYSKRHFDPSRPEGKHEHWGSSASILARSLYQQLSELGDVTYIDAFNDEHLSIKCKKFDLFVGIYSNFSTILREATIKRSVFFAVNMHPTERNLRLRNFVKESGLPDEAFASWDMADEKSIKRAFGQADSILCVGNTEIYNSYIKHGIPKDKIKMLNYSVGSAQLAKGKNPQPKRFVYVASEIGLRKGFDILHQLFTDPKIVKQKFHLTIFGIPSTPFYEAKLAKLKAKLGPKLIVKGWVDSASKNYADILQKSSFIIFPSLEEGQAGTVLDAMRRGVVPVITPQTGIDFSPLGFLQPELKSVHNKQILLSALAADVATIEELRVKTLDYYKLFHADNAAVFAEALREVQTGNVYPKISVILPIFNKEKQILPLIKSLDKSCRAYGNIEVKIIFDGCVDKTEEIVRAYYAARKPSYDIEFFVTPNIFEVKTNNMGMKASDGKYCAIIQDDIFINDPDVFREAISFMEKASQIAILGCLAGVNYYPRGMTKLEGPGQIAQSKHEVYWRQDANTDPSLQEKFFEVDACMRGPLIIRKDYLEKHGYLDEAYVPLYQDDMDIAFKARKDGYHVFCGLFDVENKSFTMANYDAKRNKFFEEIIERNTNLFYKRWRPTRVKNYLWVHRTDFYKTPFERHRRRAANVCVRIGNKARALRQRVESVPRKILLRGKA